MGRDGGDNDKKNKKESRRRRRHKRIAFTAKAQQCTTVDGAKRRQGHAGRREAARWISFTAAALLVII